MESNRNRLIHYIINSFMLHRGEAPLETNTENVPKKTPVLKKQFGYSATFSNLRLLLSETQYTSDIASKVRI